jgi:hypothetical protein
MHETIEQINVIADLPVIIVDLGQGVIIPDCRLYVTLLVGSTVDFLTFLPIIHPLFSVTIFNVH